MNRDHPVTACSRLDFVVVTGAEGRLAEHLGKRQFLGVRPLIGRTVCF
jgi:hypothetical protein